MRGVDRPRAPSRRVATRGAPGRATAPAMEEWACTTSNPPRRMRSPRAPTARAFGAERGRRAIATSCARMLAARSSQKEVSPKAASRTRGQATSTSHPARRPRASSRRWRLVPPMVASSTCSTLTAAALPLPPGWPPHRASGTGGEGLLVDGQGLLHHARGGEALPDPPVAVVAHPAPLGGVAEEADQAPARACGSRGDQESRLAVLHHLRDARDPRPHHRRPGAHRLGEDQPEPLPQGGQHEDVRRRPSGGGRPGAPRRRRPCPPAPLPPPAPAARDVLLAPLLRAPTRTSRASGKRSSTPRMASIR